MSEYPALIGLMGQKRSGKDALGSILVGEHDFTRYAFADPMRRALLTLDPFIPTWTGPIPLSEIVSDLGWDVAKEKYPEVRRLLQVFGTEVVRDQLGETIWIDLAADYISERLAYGHSVVVTDVRFPNEADLIKELGGHLVEIVRPGLPDTDIHASENAWRSIEPDRIFYNDADLNKVAKYGDYLAADTRSIVRICI